MAKGHSTQASVSDANVFSTHRFTVPFAALIQKIRALKASIIALKASTAPRDWRCRLMMP